MKMHIEELTAEAFAPFGTLIDLPQRAAEAGGDGWDWYGGLAGLPPAGAGYTIGYLSLRPTMALRFDWAERHAATAELLVPMGGEALIHVAPAAYADELGRLPAIDSFRLFRVLPGQAVLLDPKVWHGAPMALAGPLQVVVIQCCGTGPENSAVVPFGGEVIEAEE